MMKSQRKSHLQAVTLRAAILFAVIAAISIVVVEFVYRDQISDRLDTISQSAYRVLDLQHEIIHSELGSISSDLLFLAGQNELASYLETRDEQLLYEVANEYLRMAQVKGIYDQIRFLDALGMEIVRVDFNSGEPEVVAPEDLQPKGERYYFIQAFSLEAGEIFVSRFDLNVEQGVVESPRKPMIRSATPIRDLASKNRGIVILNYLGENLFDALDGATEGSEQHTFLANGESYWLRGPDSSVEWSFMHYDTGVHTVDTSFPGAWEQLSARDAGQFRTDAGLFTFTTHYPMTAGKQNLATHDHESTQTENEDVWKLISFVPADVLSAIETPIRRVWRITQGLLLALAAGISWSYARFRVLRAEHQARIEFMAKYDSLTGACNRHYFERSIADEEARARRYKHPISFLMIDITRFKQINDTHGHHVGDEVLKEVSAILKANVRETDVVVRYGGDEFLIMFPETPGEADAASERILRAIDALNADAAKFSFPVILAMGSAQWDSASGETVADALSHADEQMYEHKLAQHTALASG